MNLKKLHEKAEWQKLTESDFKTRAIDCILEQAAKIENLNKIVTDLQEDLEVIRVELGFVKKQNIRLNRKNLQRIDDDLNTEQKRDSRTIFKSGQPSL